MKTIISSLVLATALVSGGAAIASEGGNDIANRQVTESRTAFVAQSNIRTAASALDFNATFQNRSNGQTNVYPTHSQNLSQSSGR